MLQAMFAGVSGLQVHQTKLDVIGNNIANVNTLGFKAGRVTFADQLSQTLRSSAKPSADVGGQNPSQVGLGVSLGTVDTLQTQGNLQTTGKATDLAIQGNGFFLVSGGNNVLFTRDGSFDLDSDGVLVNPASGLKLLGYVADNNGNVDLSQQITNDSVLKVPVGSLTSVKKTTTSTFLGNLDASAGLQSTRVSVNGQLDTSTTAGTIKTNVYDALGVSHQLQVTFSNPVHNPASGPGNPGVPTGATQQWDVQLNLDGNNLTPQKIYAVSDGAGGNTFEFTDTQVPGGPLGSTLTINVNGSAGAANFPLTIDFGSLQAKSTITTTSDGQGGTNPIQSTVLATKGNLNLDGGATVVNTTNVFDAAGKQYVVTTTFFNPTVPTPGPNVPAGASQQWDVKIDVQPPTGPSFNAYDSSVSTNQESRAYYVPGSGFITADGTNPAKNLGSTIQLVAGTLPPGDYNQGTLLAPGFPLTVDLGALTTTKVAATGDGQGGKPPVWNTSLSVFDGLGVKHTLNFQFTRAQVGSGAPAAAAGRWEWAATENGTAVADSTAAGNSALFFDNKGDLINTRLQDINVIPKSGAGALPVSVDFSTLTQLAGDSSVAATTQDGFPVGTLQTFQISQEGLVTGIFSNGQTRTLGQIATASFSNPAGLEKLGQNLFKDSSNSGLAQVGLPNLSGRGKISTGFVEMSNVDLSTEFTNLIITQRGFQANTRIISVVDSLLQDVIDLKR